MLETLLDNSTMVATLVLIAALTMDWLLGEPRRWHPLVGFGRYAQGIERWLYKENTGSQRWRGVAALLMATLPLTGLVYWLAQPSMFGLGFSVVILYFTIGHKSLHQHARDVFNALNANDETEARYRASLIVSRDPEALDIPGATIESVLENGNDAVFGALFWFVIAGAPGALLYRLANTLDAMWGYRNQRYLQFGWAAARFDDLMNFVPARLTALTYALLGETRTAFRCWRTQAPLWDSPNAGPVMAAGAGALAVQLGGAARYDGEWHQRPQLGCGRLPTPADITLALQLLRRGVYVWVGVIAVIEWSLAYA